jgi:hypothetical protein
MSPANRPTHVAEASNLRLDYQRVQAFAVESDASNAASPKALAKGDKLRLLKDPACCY